MPWAVKLDKDEDFIGKWALARVGRASRRRRRWSASRSPTAGVPTEGAVVLDERGVAAGQVTSARRSRQLDRVIGMAWVPAGACRATAPAITIADNGSRLVGTVVTEPFYDPAGELLRS